MKWDFQKDFLKLWLQTRCLFSVVCWLVALPWPLKQQSRRAGRFWEQAVQQDPALRSFQYYAVIIAERTVKHGQGVCVCVCSYKCQRFLQQEKMRENVPATGTSWLLTFFFSVTQCNLFFSVAHVSLSGNRAKGKKETKSTAWDQASIPATGQGQMPGYLWVGSAKLLKSKVQNRGQEALAGRRHGSFSEIV